MTNLTDSTAIILVHGIGNQTKRSTLKQFLDATRLIKPEAAGYQQRIVETGTSEHLPDYYIAEDSRAGGPPNEPSPATPKIAEFYWADLSNIHTGFLADLRNLFSIGASAPDLIYATLGPTSESGKPVSNALLSAMRLLVVTMFWIIYYPVIAANLAFAILVSGFAADALLFTGSTVDDRGDIQLLVVTSLSIVILSFGVLKPAFLTKLGISDRDWSHRTRAILIIVFLFLNFSLALSSVLDATAPHSYLDFAVLSILLVGVTWVVPLFLLLLVFLPLLAALLLFFSERWKGILLGFATCFTVVNLWLITISAAWLTFMTTIFDKNSFTSLLDVTNKGIPFMSLVGLNLVVLGVAVAVQVNAFQRYAAECNETESKREFPRLIVPGSLLVLPALLAVISLFVFLNHWVPTTVCRQDCELLPGFCSLYAGSFVSQVGEFLFSLTESASRYLIIFAATLLLVASVLVRFARGGLSIAKDVVNYFQTNLCHHCANPLRAMGSAIRYGSPEEFPIRTALRNRLVALTQDVYDNGSDVKCVVFVTHSLGSMIAIDTLEHLNPNEIFNPLSSEGGAKIPDVELITMGSPYQHIFEYYFPHFFPRLPANDALGVGSVSNLFFDDDYVGTRIASGDPSIDRPSLGLGGHENYFTDTRVVKEIWKAIGTGRA